MTCLHTDLLITSQAYHENRYRATSMYWQASYHRMAEAALQIDLSGEHDWPRAKRASLSEDKCRHVYRGSEAGV